MDVYGDSIASILSKDFSELERLVIGIDLASGKGSSVVQRAGQDENVNQYLSQHKHDLLMCCGTTCNSRLNIEYVEALEKELKECKAMINSSSIDAGVEGYVLGMSAAAEPGSLYKRESVIKELSSIYRYHLGFKYRN